MPEKKFKRVILRLLKNTKKQFHEIRKSAHDMDEKFCREIEILNTN